MKKSGLNAKRQVPATGTMPKLYRPPGSIPFPDVRGKVIADVYLIAESDLSCITLCFDDNTELVVDVEPYLQFTASYSGWKNGNQRVIKRWPRVRRD